jgi:hypothetical protein
MLRDQTTLCAATQVSCDGCGGRAFAARFLLEVTEEQGLKVRDAIRLIQDDAWLQVRQRGSHRQFEHATKPVW